MKLPRSLHRWNVTPAEAIAIQRRLACRVEFLVPRKPLRYVAGLDAAFTSDETSCVAAVVLWDSVEKRVVEQHVAQAPLRFPYVPGLLSFREAPALLAALRKLRQKPDVLMCDGQGIAHPRRFGIAAHIGLLTEIPSIGCAKSILIGEHGPLGRSRGSRTALVDREERIGTVLRTRDGVNPVYVSVGHRLTLPAAEKIVMDCSIGYRLPEPTRLADHAVGVAARAQGLA
jgi:deoxyribonuclease V